MKLKTINDFDLNDKYVLLRSDLNSDVEKRRIIEGDRIKEASKTISLLKKKQARVVILAHQGNPKKPDFLNLDQHAKILNKYTKVKFVKDVIGKKAISEIQKLKKSEALLLDNVRLVSEELNYSKDNKLVKTLAPYFSLYVNDAFSVCHRKHTSIVGFPSILPSCVGPLVDLELKALEKVSMKQSVYILGGAKPESNIKLLHENKVLATGLFGQMCLVSKGKNLGYQNEYLKESTLVEGGYDKFKSKLKSKLKNVETPLDFAVLENDKRKEYLVQEFPKDLRIDDIGEKRIEKYVKIIKKAKSVYMKGPCGFAQDKRFSKGTNAILKAISESKGFSLIGGGHLSDAINNSKISKKKFGHISLSGGALLSYVAKEKLPGLEALGYYKK